MQVIKRNGKAEDVSFDKITRRIRFLLYGGLDKNIDPVAIAREVIKDHLSDGISTTLLDDISAEICIAKTITHPDFGVLAARIAVDNYQKNTSRSFLGVMRALMNNVDKNGEKCPLLGSDFFAVCCKHEARIEYALAHDRDCLIDYFGFKTLHLSYLMKIDGKPIERIQHMWMRCALFLNQEDIDKAVETYDLLSKKVYTHATPSLFHAGTVYPQMSSCYLLSIEDSIEGIFETVTRCAKISKWAGGIGVHISNIRSNGSRIRKTNGLSSGILPMLKVFDATAPYVNQAGRRKGSFAFYLEPHHPDIFDFLEAKLKTGAEEKRARNLFYALWISDYFMTCVKGDQDWYLLDPDRCPNLNEVYGNEYETLYQKYVSEGRAAKKIKARDIWSAMITAQTETGLPYVCFKDAVNHKSNQKNIGTIKSSNLCCEINEFSSTDETAVCFTGDTKVLTKEGYRRIDECDAAEVLSYFNNDEDLITEESFSKAQLIDNGVKDVFELKCTGTSEIKATGNHCFLTLEGRTKNKVNNYKWKKLEELKVGDRIILPTTKELPSYDVNIIQDLEEDYLTVGWMLGDGWQCTDKNGRTTYGVCFGPNETYARDRIINNLSQICNSVPFTKNGRLSQNSDYYTDRNGVHNWASSKQCFVKYFQEKFGLIPHKAREKVISEKIEKSKPNEIASVLSGLFSADGTVSLFIASNLATHFYVGLSSSSKKLLYQTQNLLRCFGIKSSVVWSYLKSRDRYQGKVTINKMESLQKFKKYIGFALSKSKQEILEQGLKTVKRDRVIFTDYTKVVSVTYLGKEKVYDLSVPETHNFIAEGLVAHNCNLASIALSQFVKPHDTSEYIFGERVDNVSSLKVYTVENCNWCRLAKACLRENKIRFTEKCLRTEEEIQEIKYIFKVTTFPQVVKATKSCDVCEGPETRSWKEVPCGGFTKIQQFLRPRFDFDRLYEITKIVTRNLNKVIDLNFYPTPETKRSNFRHRPIGIGVQGLADAFILMKLPFDSPEARKLNKEIFETMYYAALETSMEIAREDGPYETFAGSPLSEGKFQFDLWNEFRNPKDSYQFKLTDRWDFEGLREKIKRHGVRNSLLLAPMPTASTAQILGNNEAFEPYTSNIYTRRTLAGEYVVVNKHLVRDLINCDLWTDAVKEKIKFYQGSVQKIKEVPGFLKEIYKTVWEIKQKVVIDMAADRGHYICQSQSMNIHLAEPTEKLIYNALFYGWKRGLKTGMYYLRSQPASNAQQVTIDPETARKIKDDEEQEEICIMCSS